MDTKAVILVSMCQQINQLLKIMSNIDLLSLCILCANSNSDYIKYSSKVSVIYDQNDSSAYCLLAQ